jgi:hypothetical protein
MTPKPLTQLDHLAVRILQLSTENHKLQSIIYEMQLNAKVKELAAQYGREEKELDPQTLTWMVDE